MAVEVGKGVIYRWNTIRENELSSIQSWTDAAKAIKDVTDDVYRLAEVYAPARSGHLKRSHYRAGHRRRGRYRIEQVVGNRAEYALWVHEGTTRKNGMYIVAHGRGMGPIGLGGGYRELSRVPDNHRWWGLRSAGNSRDGVAYFTHFRFRGQRGKPWLERAGRDAYRLPGNN